MQIKIPTLDLIVDFDPKETNPQVGDKFQIGRSFYVIYKIEGDIIYCGDEKDGG